MTKHQISLSKFYPVVIILICTAIISCSDYVTRQVTKLELSFAIKDATRLLTTSNEGTVGGFQMRGSGKILSDSILQAQGVYADSKMTWIKTKYTNKDSIVIQTAHSPFSQARIDEATNNLKTAMEVYKNSKVVEVDPVNLMGHWTFNNLASNDVGAVVTDYSGRNNHGKLALGSAFWGRGNVGFGTDRYGVFGPALFFTAGGYVEVPYSADLNGPRMTISLWARPTGSNSNNKQYAVSLGRRTAYQYFLSANPTSQTFSANPAESPGNYITELGDSYAEGVWKHFVVTFGDGFVRFYQDGVLKREVAATGTVKAMTTPVNLAIGQDLPTAAYSSDPANPYYLNSGGFFIGYLDDVRIYKTVLNATQIASIYNLEKF